MVEQIKGSNFRQWAWITFLATLVMVPFSVGTIPFSGQPFMVNHTTALHGPALWFGVVFTTFFLIISAVSAKKPLRTHWIQWPLVAAALFVVLSAVTSMDVWSSFSGNMNDALDTSTWLALIVFILLGIELVESNMRVNQIVSTLIHSSSVLAIFVLVDQFFEAEVFTPAHLVDQLWSVHQGGSVFGNPDVTGVFLIAPALLAIYRALTASKKSWATYYWVCSLLLSVALLRTLTRASWIALAIGVIIFLVTFAIKKHSRSRVWLLIAFTLLSVIILLASAFPSDLASKVSGIKTEISSQPGSRFSLAQEAFRVIFRHPFTGTGPANYRLGWEEVRAIPATPGASTPLNSDAHSLPLQLAATLGIGFLVAMMVLVCYSIFAGVHDSRKKTNEPNIFFACAVSLGCVLLASCVSVSNISILVVMGVLCVVLISSQFGDQTQKRYLSAGLPVIFSLVAVVLIVSLLTIPYQSVEAAQAAEGSSPGIQLLELGNRFPYQSSFSSYGCIAVASQISTSALGNEEGAVTNAVDVAVLRHENDAALLYAAAQVYSRLGSVTGNEVYLRQGLQLANSATEKMPYYAESVLLSVQLYATLGEADQALAIAKDYLSVVPADASMAALVSKINAARN